MHAQKPISYYELYPSDIKDLQSAVENLGGYFKTLSMLYLRMMDYPILKGIIVPKWNRQVATRIARFCEENRFEKLLLRIDKIQETGKAPRGGYLVDCEKVEKEVIHYLKGGRIIILLEPKSPYNDLYSINALFAADRDDVVLEIVGPGFDASDLNRGDISPHQILSFPKTVAEIPSNISRILRQIHIVSSDTYKQSVEQRLFKIGMTQARLNSLDISAWAEKKIAQLGEKYLQKGGQTLLLNNRETYAPISTRYLEMVLPYIIELPKKLQKLRAEIEPTMVLSMSILNENEGRLNFWDIVWPSLKYTGVHKK